MILHNDNHPEAYSAMGEGDLSLRPALCPMEPHDLGVDIRLRHASNDFCAFLSMDEVHNLRDLLQLYIEGRPLSPTIVLSAQAGVRLVLTITIQEEPQREGIEFNVGGRHQPHPPLSKFIDKEGIGNMVNFFTQQLTIEEVSVAS